jgi:hypothetical protein
VGGILPFQDRCQPIAYSSSITNVSKVTRGKRRYATRHDQTNSRQTQFGTNVVVRLTGRVGIKPFCSSGFEIMSPVLQKCPDQMLNQHRHHHHHQQRLPYEMHSLSYDRVLYQNEVHHLAEILRDHRRGSISLPFDGEEGTFFNIYSSSSKQILEKLFHKDYDNLNTNSCVDIENDHTIERIEMVLYTPNHEIISLGTHWKDNMYGVFAMQNATTARKAYQQSLVQLKQDQDQEGYHFLGAFMVICCLKGQNLYQETSVESHLFQQMFPTLPFTGMCSVLFIYSF